MRSLGGPEKNGLCGHNRETDGDWSNGSVVAGTGSLDILIDLPYNSVAAVCDALLQTGDSPVFWETARQCASQTKAWLANGWARESLLLFGAGWEFMNMNRVVELGAQVRSQLNPALSVVMTPRLKGLNMFERAQRRVLPIAKTKANMLRL